MKYGARYIGILPFFFSIWIIGSCSGGFGSKAQKQQASQSSGSGIPGQAEGYGYRYAARTATAGVVYIKTVFPAASRRQLPDIFEELFGEDFFDHERLLLPAEKPVSGASGVIIRDDGYIVTNFHVIDQAESIEVVLHDQRSYNAKIIGTDSQTDLALLKIDEKKLPFIAFGNSDSIEVGDIVLAAGNPFNLSSTVTQGIISAKARKINLLSHRLAVESFLQTDAAVNPGNSGGALVDLNGRLVGITAAIASPNGTYAGYAFAIPVEIVKKTFSDLLKYGKVRHATLGIMISNMNGDKARSMGITNATGVLVESIDRSGAGRTSALEKNDVIEKIGDRKVETVSDVQEIIARARPGEYVQMRVIRNRKEMLVRVLLLPVNPLVEEEIAEQVLGRLGIEAELVSGRERDLPGVSGLKVTSVQSGKVADKAGMKAGFIITKVNGLKVTPEGLKGAFEASSDGIMLEGLYPGRNAIYYFHFE